MRISKFSFFSPLGILSFALFLLALPLALYLSSQQQTLQQHASGPQIQPLGQKGNWNLIFDDEFNGASNEAPDPSKWAVLGGPSPAKWGTECFVNDRAHIYQDGQGHLIEKATYNPTGVPCRNGSGPYESGGMTTSGIFSFKYGAIESRIQVPCQSGNGLWPALWSDGPNWPQGGEIDYLEVMQGYNGTNAKQSLHGAMASGGHWNIGNNNIASTQWCHQFHTYGAVWSPGKIQFTLDGITTATDTPTNLHAGWIWPFDVSSEHLLLDLQTGGSGGQINNSSLPQSMLVDYVRVWQMQQGCAHCITPTVMPTTSQTGGKNPVDFFLTICPHELGNCGDNTRLDSLGNATPKHATRPVTLLLYNQNNALVAMAKGSVSYSSAAKDFQGTIAVPITSGSYLITIRMNGYLGKQIPTIISVSTGQKITLPQTVLITGDVNNDNKLNILDYQALMSCFANKTQQASCAAPLTNTSTGADLNDDGVVDGVDYNIFIREFSVQQGISGGKS